MDSLKKSRNYDRVMSRVFNRSRSSLRSSSNVARHEVLSSVGVGAKPSVSALSSSVFNELPTVLNDYVPEMDGKKVVKRPLVKPRRTLKSLDPGNARSPPRASRARAVEYGRSVRARGSAPIVVSSKADEWSESHVRECYSSRSHIRLKELKNEIKAFRETDKLMKLRSNLYKSCGVVLDDVGEVAKDQAVQADPVPDEETPCVRSERSSGENAGAAVSDQQMRSGGPQYPVDRYLVESSKKIEMVNIIDDIWNPEPSLRPEEEIILRKLHEMLQSTADDLKLLSGELTRSREPGTRVRAAPAPLDDEFNEKVHIEEVVNAKFHGYEMVDKPPKLKRPEVINKPQNNVLKNTILNARPKVKTTATKRLTKSRTNVVQINATPSTKQEKVEEVKKPGKETVAYSEFSYEYPKQKVEIPTKGLQVQLMPSINIRSELKEQKVLHLDIMPESVNDVSNTDDKSNVAVIIVQYDAPTPTLKAPQVRVQQDYLQTNIIGQKATRKVTKMVTCESSSSTNNVSSDQCNNVEIPLLKNIRAPAKTTARIDRSKIKNNKTSKTEPPKRTHFNLDEWKNKLNSVYGQPSSSRKNKTPTKYKPNVKKLSPKKTNVRSANVTKPQPKLNNAQYIPYSQLTLGGVSVSDIEREISNIPNRSNMPLSPILDKIISSQENSRHNSPRKNKQRNSPNILTTSDENLLQEVLDIEHTVSKTLSKNLDIELNELKASKISSDSTNEDTNEPDSYADDFEDEKSNKANSGNNSPRNEPQGVINSSESKDSSDESGDSNVEGDKLSTTKDKTNVHNLTYSKPNLTLKNSVDVFEYVHAIDTQDTATQIQTTNKISLKETQTSPRNVASNVPVQPIHNDLWPVVDPSKEVEKMFELEKDLIKKLIIDEYGDLFQRSIDKPSTSKENQESLNTGPNMLASQKVTQTSPKFVKSVMTSPTKTKTRTTSPFHLSLAVDHQTSPMVLVTNEEHVRIEVAEDQEPEDQGISINLSSPRFSLRLPNTSVEVLSNLEICSRTLSNVSGKNTVRNESSDKLPKPVRKIVSSSSSLDADQSSSEISSLGEVKSKLRRRLKKKVQSLSEFTSSSSSSSKLSMDYNSASILPLRSEGEVTSIPRSRSRNTSHHITSKSEGEISFGKRLA